MRGLLFARVNFSKPANGGIFLKCQGQLLVLKEACNDFDFLYFLEDGLYLNQKRIYTIDPAKIEQRSYLAKLYMFDLGKIISETCDLSNYDFLYFRYCLSSKALLQFLQAFKIKNPNTKIVADFPTYPYEQEYKSIPQKIELKFDIYYRKKIFNLIDRIAHLGTAKEIYDTAVLQIGNGINEELFPASSNNTDWKKLQLIAVGNFNYWHGIDRLIYGIQNYKGDTKIEVRIIGNGWEESKKLCKELNIDSMFSFYPPLSKLELDQHYDWANCGVGTLGIHRKGVIINQSLKHREYAARGLNFFYAGVDPGFIPGCEGIINLEESENPIDINLLLSKNFKNNTSLIKSYAKKNLSWEKTMLPVINYFQKDNNV